MKLTKKLKTKLDSAIKVDKVSDVVSDKVSGIVPEKHRNKANEELSEKLIKELSKEKNKALDDLETKLNDELKQKGIELDYDDDNNITTLKYKGYDVELTENGIKSAILGLANGEIDKLKSKHSKYISSAENLINMLKSIQNNTVFKDTVGLINKSDLLHNNIVANPAFSALGTGFIINDFLNGETSIFNPIPIKDTNAIDTIDVIGAVKQNKSSTAMNAGNNCMRIVFYDIKNPHAVEISQFGGKQAIEYLQRMPNGEKVEPRTILKMPMPSNLQQGFNSSWGEYSNVFNSMIAHGFEGGGDPLSLIKNIAESGSGMDLGDLMQVTALPAMLSGTANMSLSSGVSTATDEAIQYLRAVGGMVINPMTSLTYTSHSTRTHNYEWTLIPKSKSDWEIIKKAYYAFLSASYASNSEELSSSTSAHKPNKSVNDIMKNYGFIYRKTMFANIYFEDIETGEDILGTMIVPDCNVVDVSIKYSPNTRIMTITEDDFPLGITISVSFREKYALNRHDYKYLKNGYEEITGTKIGDRWQEYEEFVGKSKNTLEQAISTGAISKKVEETPQTIPSDGSTTSPPPDNSGGSSKYAEENRIAAEKAYNQAHAKTQGRCLQYVRTALGLSGGVPHAYQYGFPDIHPNMTKIGYQVVQSGSGAIEGKFTPQIGDVVVIDRVGNHTSGHIAIYTSGGWVSDFKQSSANVYSKIDGWKLMRR